MLLEIRDRTNVSDKVKPHIGADVFIAETASVIGDVKIGDRSSIWFGAVIRGDVCSIRVGKECNIQDGAIIHGTYKKCGATLDDRVSIGHGALIHGCEIGENSLIGMGAIIMDQVKIGRGCLIGAGTLLTEGTVVEDGMLVFGNPGKVIRPLSEKEKIVINKSPDNYLIYKSWY